MLGCTAFEVDSSKYVADKGLVYTKDKSTIVACPGGLIDVSIPDSTSAFFDLAFYKCSNLQNIHFSNSSKLKSIGVSTFYGCISITKIDFPKYLLLVDESAFRDCEKLITVTFPVDSLLSNIGVSAFSGCSMLNNIILPKSFKVINQSAFSECTSLEYVSMFDIETLGANSFSGCTSLRTVSVCKAATNGLFDETAFIGCPENLVIYVPMAFSPTTISARPVLKILDHDCAIPTHVFSLDGRLYTISPAAALVVCSSDI